MPDIFTPTQTAHSLAKMERGALRGQSSTRLEQCLTQFSISLIRDYWLFLCEVPIQGKKDHVSECICMLLCGPIHNTVYLTISSSKERNIIRGNVSLFLPGKEGNAIILLYECILGCR